jgi:hypothetical protein
MRKAVGLLLALLSLGAAHAADPVWHWIWVVPSPDPTKGWKVFEGDAPVSFDGSSLKATLKGEAEGWEPELRVEGHVKGRAIEAVVTELGTDASPQRYKGGFDRWRSKPTDAAAGWGGDRIWLDVGPNHLGLYRQVPPKQP